MSSKFYVWTGGRWCEVCPVTGRVRGSGWRGKARFVFVRKGRLCMARNQRILRGLQALAAGQPTTVQDDAKLEKRKKKRPKQAPCSGCRHSGCPARDNSVKNEKMKTAQETNLINVAVQSEQPRIEPATALSKSSATERLRFPSPTGSETTIDNFNELYKELIIEETDVDIYRSYLIKNHPFFDLLRFDSDENYKLKIFYKINPLVAIEKCKQIENMLRASPCSQDTLSLKDFATKLGLQSISDQEMEKNKKYKMRSRKKEMPDDTDKENRLQNETEKVTDKNNAKSKLLEAVRRNITKDSKPETKMKTQDSQKQTVTEPGIEPEKANEQILTNNVPPIKTMPMKFKRSKVPKVYNGYSNLEDHAIVAWVSGGRSRLVNGNKIWRELQGQFPKLTGVQRTFHSLRNRYLRYILPSLPQLALSPKEAARLRADATAGVIKSRKKSEPYPFEYPRVRSAWGVRDKDKVTDTHSPMEDSETPIDKDSSVRERKTSRDVSKSPQKSRLSLDTSQSNTKKNLSQKLPVVQSKKAKNARNESPSKHKRASPIPSPSKKKAVSDRNESSFRSDKQTSSSKKSKSNKIESRSKSRKQSPVSSNNKKYESNRNSTPVGSRKKSPIPSHKEKYTYNRIKSPARSRNQSPNPSTNNKKSSSNKNVSPTRSQKQSPIKSHSNKKSTYKRNKSPSRSRNQSSIPSTSKNKMNSNKTISPNRSQNQSPIKSQSRKKTNNRNESPSPIRRESRRSRKKSSSESPVRNSRSPRKSRKDSYLDESSESTTSDSLRSSRTRESSRSLDSFQEKSRERLLRNRSMQETQLSRRDSPHSRSLRNSLREPRKSPSLLCFQSDRQSPPRPLKRDSLGRWKKRASPRQKETQLSRRDSPHSRSLRNSLREPRKSPSLLCFQSDRQSPPRPQKRDSLGRWKKRASPRQKRSRSSSSSAVRVVKKAAVRAVSISSDSSEQFEVKREADRSIRSLRRRSRTENTSKGTQSEVEPTTSDNRRPRTRKLYNHNVRPH